MSEKKEEVICSDCKGFMYVGGADVYSCGFKGSAWSSLKPAERQKIIEQQIRIRCEKFDLAPRQLRIKMRDLLEVGITKVYGNGSVQIPSSIREEWSIKDGDKILWVRRGVRDYTFRKVGFKSPFKPHFT